jgi:hypothetical protein
VGLYRLALSDGGVLTSRTVIIATGVAYRRLGVPALGALQGRGVFYGANLTPPVTRAATRKPRTGQPVRPRHHNHADRPVTGARSAGPVCQWRGDVHRS